MRYNKDGSLGTTFGTNGIVSIDFGGVNRGVEIALDSNGMIIVAGRSGTGSGNDFAVARLFPFYSIISSICRDFTQFPQKLELTLMVDVQCLSRFSLNGECFDSSSI